MSMHEVKPLNKLQFSGFISLMSVRVREPDPLDRGDVISELGPPREPYGHIVVQ